MLKTIEKETIMQLKDLVEEITMNNFGALMLGLDSKDIFNMIVNNSEFSEELAIQYSRKHSGSDIFYLVKNIRTNEMEIINQFLISVEDAINLDIYSNMRSYGYSKQYILDEIPEIEASLKIAKINDIANMQLSLYYLAMDSIKSLNRAINEAKAIIALLSL